MSPVLTDSHFSGDRNLSGRASGQRLRLFAVGRPLPYRNRPAFSRGDSPRWRYRRWQNAVVILHLRAYPEPSGRGHCPEPGLHPATIPGHRHGLPRAPRQFAGFRRFCQQQPFLNLAYRRSQVDLHATLRQCPAEKPHEPWGCGWEGISSAAPKMKVQLACPCPAVSARFSGETAWQGVSSTPPAPVPTTATVSGHRIFNTGEQASQRLLNPVMVYRHRMVRGTFHSY